MSSFATFKRQHWLLSASVAGLMLCSLVMLASINQSLFFQQLGWAVIALFIIIIFSHLDWRALASYQWIIGGVYFFSLALLIATYFFAPTIRNTRAWLVVGPLQFQVSEFVKVALIILLAYFFSRRHLGIGKFSTILRTFIYFVIPGIFIFLQPDMGTLIVLFCIWAGFLLVSGLPLRYIIGGFLLLVLVVLVSWFSVLKPYQRERIVGLFDPTYDPLGVNYSTIQSKIAVGSGQWFGKGFGQGTQVQLGFLPEASTDYILSGFIEEWGFVGALVVFAIFGLMIFTLLRIGLAADNNFYRFICLGTAIMFLTQFGINVGSALGLLPVIGITFPFFSYGGSSLMVNALLIGAAQSAAIHRSMS